MGRKLKFGIIIVLALFLSVQGILQSAASLDMNPVTDSVYDAGTENERWIQNSVDQDLLLSQSQSQSNEGSNPTITFNGQNTVELVDPKWLEVEDGIAVTFNLNIFNGTARDLSLIDYWLKLVSNQGAVYPVQLIQADQEKERISPMNQGTLQYYAKLPLDANVNDLQIQWIEWDFDQPNYERIIGTLSLASNYISQVPEGTYGIIKVGNIRVHGKVNGLEFSYDDEGHYADLEVEVQNSGYWGVVLPKLEYYLRDSEGRMYHMKLETEGEIQVQPNDTSILELTAQIPDDKQSEDWELVIAVVENEQILLPVNSFFVPLGTDLIDDEPDVHAPHGTVLEQEIDEVPVETSASHVEVKRQKNHTDAEVTFTVRNIGNERIVWPERDYSLRTSEGVFYPLAPDEEGLQVLPRFSEEILLAGKLPLDMDVTGAQLWVEPPMDENQRRSGLTYTYALEVGGDIEEPVSDTLGMGQAFPFSNDDGEYELKLTSFQRVPWEDQDILVAEVFVKNKDDKALPLPSLGASFKLDNISLAGEQINGMQLNRILSLKPEAETEYLLFTKVPYTYEYEQVSLRLQDITDSTVDEGDSGEEPADLVEYEFVAQDLALPELEDGEPFLLESIGQRASVSVRDVVTFRSDDAKLFYAELEVENMERRVTKLPNINGYLKTVDDYYFPVEIDVMEQSVLPSSKALLALTSQVPFDVLTSQLSLVLGREVAMEEDLSMVNASLIELPFERDIRAKNDLQNLNMFPYNLNVNIQNVTLSKPESVLNFSYELSKNRSYAIHPDGHEVVIEWVDGDKVYEQTFKLDEDMVLGTHTGTMTAPIEYSSLNIKLQEVDGFEIRVYHQYEGFRKHLGTQTARLIYSSGE